MSTAEMREKIHKKIDILDELKLHQILDLINEDDNEESYWSPEFIKELDRRRAEMLTGKVKGIGAEEITERVREKIIQKYGTQNFLRIHKPTLFKITSSSILFMQLK